MEYIWYVFCVHPDLKRVTLCFFYKLTLVSIVNSMTTKLHKLVKSSQINERINFDLPDSQNVFHCPTSLCRVDECESCDCMHVFIIVIFLVSKLVMNDEVYVFHDNNCLEVKCSYLSACIHCTRCQLLLCCWIQLEFGKFNKACYYSYAKW